jgi:2-haloacid dehalogenase
VAKPDPEIFRRVVERFDLDPRTTLLIDDAERNITAARGLGWQAIHFTSPADLRSALAGLGLVAAG